MAAHALVRRGLRVLMLERGGWVDRGPHNWSAEGTFEASPHYSQETPFRVQDDGRPRLAGTCACVGGASVFYGGVSLRLREQDFQPHPEIVRDSDARWPVGYSTLEPYYGEAERLLDVAGTGGDDPTEPPRSTPYPQPPGRLSGISGRLAAAAQELGLSPFRLPLAINYGPDSGRPRCVRCGTCDTFPCAIEAKNDLATKLLPDLIRAGLELRANTVVTRLIAAEGRMTEVECQDGETGRRYRERARVYILSAGALASPHLLLASGLQALNPGGHVVGRYLMRHCSGIVFGAFARPPEDVARFHKQIGLHDFYMGDGSDAPPGKLGSIQQLQSPPISLVRAMAPAPFARPIHWLAQRTAGLLAMAEDQPRYENRVTFDPDATDRFGLPQPILVHHYSDRDRMARRSLLRRAREVLWHAGARLFYVHTIRTFSHALGTVRAGEDPRSSALDPWCRFRGVENLYVLDASFMPTSGGVNPSLTIAANALRVGERIVGRMRESVAEGSGVEG